MAEELLIYPVAVTGLFCEGLKDVETPEFRRQLKATGIDPSKPLPGYPYSLWEDALELTAPLFPSLTPEQRHEELGRRTVVGSTSNPIVRAVMSIAGIIGTTRALKHLIGRSGAHNSNPVTFGAESPTMVVVNTAAAGRMPSFSVGSFKELARMLGGANPRCTIVSSTPFAASYLVEWD